MSLAPQPQPTHRHTCPHTCEPNVHTCTHTHAQKVKAFMEAGGSARLSHRQKLVLSGQAGRATVLVMNCPSVVGKSQEGPRCADGPVGGHPAASRGRLSCHGASGAPELCKQEAQPRPLGWKLLASWNRLLNSDLLRAGGQAQGLGDALAEGRRAEAAWRGPDAPTTQQPPAVDTPGCGCHPPTIPKTRPPSPLSPSLLQQVARVKF